MFCKHKLLFLSGKLIPNYTDSLLDKWTRINMDMIRFFFAFTIAIFILFLVIEAERCGQAYVLRDKVSLNTSYDIRHKTRNRRCNGICNNDQSCVAFGITTTNTTRKADINCYLFRPNGAFEIDPDFDFQIQIWGKYPVNGLD